MSLQGYDSSGLVPSKNQVIVKNQFYKTREKFVARLSEYVEVLLNPEDWVVVIMVSILRNLASDISNWKRFSECAPQSNQEFDPRINMIVKTINKAGEMLDEDENRINEAREVLYMVSVQIGRLRFRNDSLGDRYAKHMDERADEIDQHWQTLGLSRRPELASKQRFLKAIWDALQHVDVHCNLRTGQGPFYNG